jgi:shikimate dehydrogenase
MSKLKILDVHPGGASRSFQFLQKLSEEQKWDLEFHQVSSYEEIAGQKPNMVLVPLEYSAKIFPRLTVVPTQVRLLRCFDSFFEENGKLYPRIIIAQALHDVLVERAKDLDTRTPAFVIGEGEFARIATAVLAEMGINEIYLVGSQPALGQHAADVRKSFFGVQFNVLPLEELTMQSVSAGIIVNTVDLKERKDLLADLSYFNFMKADGYVMDLNLNIENHQLLEEAERADLRVLPPVQVYSALTLLWLERLQLNHNLSIEDLEQRWKRFLT